MVRQDFSAVFCLPYFSGKFCEKPKVSCFSELFDWLFYTVTQPPETRREYRRSRKDSEFFL